MLDQVDVIANQARQMAENQVRGAVARTRRSTSIVAMANARMGKAYKDISDRANKKGHYGSKTRKKAGVYADEGLRLRMADGYERKSPVQEVWESPTYRQNIIKKCILVGVLLAIISVALYYIVGYVM